MIAKYNGRSVLLSGSIKLWGDNPEPGFAQKESIDTAATCYMK